MPLNKTQTQTMYGSNSVKIIYPMLKMSAQIFFLTILAFLKKNFDSIADFDLVKYRTLAYWLEC